MTDISKVLESLTEEQRQELLKALINSTPNKSEKPTSKTTVVNEDFRVVKDASLNSGRNPVKFKNNTWQDSGEYKDDDDLKTPKYNPTPRNRERSKKIEVECHVCGKTFLEDPRYVYGEYLRCSKCGRR
jgi:hypothetical protein